jgi:FMN phosphatase YigB (HAD superfamily)
VNLTTLLFDIGGVIVQTQTTVWREAWERRLGLPAWGLSDAVFNTPLGAQAFVGAADERDIWCALAERFSLSRSERDLLAHDFWRGDGVNQALLQQIYALRGRYRLGILSNGFRDMRARDARRIDFSQFDAVTYSCEEGIKKPAAAVYARALARLGSTAAETLFIDDFLENIEAARALGLHAVHFTASFNLAQVLADQRGV